MNDTWAFGLLFSASHPFFGLGIAWVWTLALVLGPCLFTLRLWPHWCSCHPTALILLWYHLSLCLVVTFGLIGWSICHVNFLYYSFFWSYSPTNPFRTLGFLGLFHSFGIAHFILPYFFHSHGCFAKSFGLPRPNYHILTFRAYWPLSQPHEFTNSFLWASPTHFLLSFHLLQFPWAYYFIPWASSTHLLSPWPLVIFCGPVDHYSCHSSLMVFILLFSFSIFFILLGFFCHWTLLSKVSINIQLPEHMSCSCSSYANIYIYNLFFFSTSFLNNEPYLILFFAMNRVVSSNSPI